MARILIVDDNIMNCKMAIRILEPLQMEIDTAENGKMALEKIQENVYDLVLMDHMMPVMDGVEAVKLLRTLEDGKYEQLPVIALTAGTDSETESLVKSAGMNDLVTKPIDAGVLYGVLQRWLPEEQIVSRNTDCGIAASEDTLPEIAGIDVSEGLKHSGSMASLTSLWGIFYQLIDTKSQKIVQCLRDNLIRDYTIEVHGLKSNARMIGALELSTEFEHLEQLGNANDVEGIRRETPQVLKHYCSYKVGLAPYGTMVNQSGREVSVEELIFCLREMEQAAQAFDLDLVDVALAELAECRMPQECQSLLEHLRVYVADVDMENVADTAQRIIDKLVR